MRPRKRDVARIRAIRDQLQVIEHGRSALEGVLPAIGELIGVEKAVAYTIAPSATHLQLDLLYGSGIDVPETRRLFQGLMSRGPVRFTAYDVLRPEPEQRNLATDCARRLGWESMRALPVYQHGLVPLGLANHNQLRVLVCEGRTLLAYLGGWRHDNLYSDYERQLLQAITPDLQRALRLERQLRDAPQLQSALGAALESIPGEAYVLDRLGNVTHANAAGRGEIERDRRTTCELLKSASKWAHPGFEFRRLVGGGLLAVRRGSDQREARVAAARARYDLTARQAEVLLELARGKSNVEIAAALGCSVPTVESHLRALFEKLECESRAGLLARLLE